MLLPTARLAGEDDRGAIRPEEIELPDMDLPVFDIDDLENPLFRSIEIEEMPDPAADPAPPRESDPADPGIPPPSPEDRNLDMTPAERELFRVARTAAPAVLSLRAYDRFGIELSRTAGFFITRTGAIATDISLVTPAIQADVSYITAIAGDRTTFRIRGVWLRDMESGVLVLQADAINTPYLTFADRLDADPEAKVFLVAFHDERGLLLADARARLEESLAGEGWLEITGEDSPGDPGSPLLNTDARVVGLVAMSLPLERWVNYAVPLGGIPTRSYTEDNVLVPVDNLEQLPSEDIRESTRFLKAYQLLYEGKYRQALRLLVRLSRSHPRSPGVWALLGLAFRKAGAPGEALSAQRKAVALDPGAGSQWRQLALSEMALGADDEARLPDIRTALERAVTERPGDRLSWLLLAQAHIERGEWSEADRALRQVVKIEPDYSQGLYLLAFVRGKLGDYANAERVVRRSLQVNKRNADSWFLLGLLLDRGGDPREAVDAYERCVRLDPRHPNAWANLASAYKKTGNAGQARQAMRRHSSLGASDAR